MSDRQLDALPVIGAHPAHANLLGKIKVVAVERVAFFKSGLRAIASTEAEERVLRLPPVQNQAARQGNRGVAPDDEMTFAVEPLVLATEVERAEFPALAPPGHGDRHNNTVRRVPEPESPTPAYCKVAHVVFRAIGGARGSNCSCDAQEQCNDEPRWDLGLRDRKNGVAPRWQTYRV